MSVLGPRPRPEPRVAAAVALERRAVRGVGALVMRTLGLQVVTLLGTLVLVRSLSPKDYGLFAIALAVQQIGRSLIELGLPVPLVQRDTPPTVAEQRAVTGFVLAVGLLFAATAALIAFVVLPFLGVRGDAAKVIAVAGIAVPIFALRMVPMVLMERSLSFGRIVVVEVCETLAFYAFAIPVALSWGSPYSLAGAVPAAALAGVVAATVLRPWKLGLSLDFGRVRPMARFGLQVGALHPLQMTRELGVLAAATAVGGPALAGFYSVAQRLFIVHTALLTSIQRVGLPVLSRARTAADRQHQVARAVALSALAAGLPTAVLVGAAEPLVAFLFGPRWSPSADVVLACAPGFFVAVSLVAVLSSAAWAAGQPAAPLRAAAASAVVSFGLALILVGRLHEVGIGLAASGGLLTVALVLIHDSSALPRAALLFVLKALGVAAIAGAVGATFGFGRGIVGVGSAVGLASLAWLLGSALVARPELRLGVRVLDRNLRHR
jgi:lipopolysaccharide exporter